MADAGIPREIREFLGKYITTIEQFEILLLLFRQAGKAWSIDEVTSELGAARPTVGKSLEELKRHGLASQQQGMYQIVLDDGKRTQLLQQLSQVYAERRVTIINFIFSRHLERIQAFADSFKLTKRDTDG